MRLPRSLLLSLCLALGVFTGCELFSPAERPSDALLQAASMSPDSVAMEIFFVRLPHDDRQAYDAIWREVDETSLDTGLRQRLGENGVRAGVIAAQLPTPIQQLLQRYEMIDSPAEANQPATGNGAFPEANTVQLDKEPAVTMRRLQLRSGRRGEMITSNLKSRAEVLMKDENAVRGRTFQNCQGMFAIKAFPETDGRARFEVIPELHHGEPQQRFSGADGVWKLETAKPRQVFDELLLDLTLSPGEMVLIGSAPHRPGSLGHHLFTEDQGGEVHRKLLFVRLTHTQ